MSAKWAGVEDIKLSVMNNASSDSNFQLFASAYCWIDNIESDYADGDHVNAASSYRCEIKRSYFHDGFTHGAGSTDDCIKLTLGSSGFLVENNIIRRMHCAVMMWGGSSGHVIAYNYITNNFNAGCNVCLMPEIDFHGAHPVMVLVEGNIFNSFNADGTWGTASHSTALRNRITGQNYSNNPNDDSGRAAEGSTWTKQYAGAWAINLAGYGVNQSFNIVGNILGISTMGNYPSFNPVFRAVWGTDTRSWDHAGTVLTLGYMGTENGPAGPGSTLPYTTIIDHGNWDVVNNTVTYDSGIADHVIPSSYYLSSKPSWFGILTWPPIDSSNVSLNITNQPAYYRWINGSAPPNESTNSGYSTRITGTRTARGTMTIR